VRCFPKMDETPQDPDGGGGLLFSREDNLRSDLKMVEQAIVNGWKIDPEWLESLPKAAAEIALDPARAASVRLRGMGTLVVMHGQNQRDRLAQQPQQHEHSHIITVDERRSRALAIVARLRALDDSGGDTGDDEGGSSGPDNSPGGNGANG